MNPVVWTPRPENVARTRIYAFARSLERKYGVTLPDYAALRRFSLERYPEFWSEVWDFCGLIGDRNGSPVVVDQDSIMRARFFPEAKLNFAENLLRRRGEDAEAVTFWREGEVVQRLSFRELDAEVSRLARALQAAGVKPGDRVAGYMPNMPETLIAMLATTAIGAIWSVCSPDLGVNATLDRLGQISPSVLFAADGAWYGGKRFDALAKAKEIAASIPSLQQVVVIPYLSADSTLDLPNAKTWQEFTASHSSTPISFERFPFNHPVFILYTSGTTGQPKCIVHGAGGTLLQHLKEHQLHFDLQPGERMFRVTTSGWMLWNALVTALASGASIVLADGSPLYPRTDSLFDLIEREKIAVAGVPPALISALKREGLSPRKTHQLSHLKCMVAGGARVSPEEYAFVYEEIQPDVHFTSPSGGTDIIAAFGSGNPIGPCRAGEIQVVALGMKAEIFNADAKPVIGEPGELVCTLPFPSVPLEFWGDKSGERLYESYFAHWPNIWRHGDWAEITENGGFIVHGRSDATLNIKGVRIGTAEIYRQLEAIGEVGESVVVAQDYDNDARSVLFVRMKDAHQLDAAMIEKIRQRIRAFASPRHVPDLILAVADIPKTANGKISEVAVKDAIHGRPVRNLTALSNPQALDLYRNIPQLM
jgi:acetoacetyl-CoA synthetase